MNSTSTFSFQLDGRKIAIGRDPSCALMLQGIGISRLHAFLQLDPEKPAIIDNESSFGTRVNGRPIVSHYLQQDDTVIIGVAELAVSVAGGTITLSKVRRRQQASVLPEPTKSSDRIRIGRDPSNDICIAHPLVSRFHAEVRKRAGEFQLVDTGSTNGVFVNGRPVRHARLDEGDVLQIGPQRLALAEGKLLQTDDRGKIKLEAVDVAVRFGNSVILDGISLSINPGEFVAILGPSGAGKTSLAHALTGSVPLSGGGVFYNGLPLRTFFSAFSAHIGFVSQENLLHKELTVFESLREQSVLRLPRDSIEAERSERIREILSMLDMERFRHRRIGDLSGGEAKRVHLGVELLSSPAIIFLDEPLAGLDTGLVRRFMELFHVISKRGHTLLLTTHALEQVDLCDRILFINNGHLVYDGKPGDTASAFGVESLGEVYEKIRSGPVAVHRAAAPGTGNHAAATLQPSRIYRPKTVSPVAQLGVLVLRYWRVLVRDRRNLTLLLAQAPLIALLLMFVYKHDSSYLPLSFYFCVSISAIWCGGMNSVREIAREWASFGREYRGGLSAAAYVVSKIVVFGLVAALQAVLFGACYRLLFPHFSLTPDILVLLAAGSISGSVLGLLISAFSGNVNRAASLLPVFFIPQIFFSGILVPFDRMTAAGDLLSRCTVARPIFSLFKRVCFLQQSVWDKTEWLSLFAICTVSIILIFSAVKWRKAGNR
jgi:ABC-type multidrug transport system ATPase subunit/pSer/pThr/pTyr-binding forkhead associated (FHA) protein